MISVIIPTYNSAKTIGKCLEALRSQTIKDYEIVDGEKTAAHLNRKLEIIVVDDGSKDNTPETVKAFKTVRFFERPHKGPAAARNFGAKMAHGDILLFTDADCEPDKNWAAEMAAPFNDKSVAGVSGTYRTRQKEIIARFAQYEIEERHDKMAKAKSIDFIGTFSAGYRKKIFDRYGGFDESFLTSAGEDPELSFRIAEAGHKITSQGSKLFGASEAPKMVLAPKAIVYHTHPDTIWKYLRQKYRNARWRLTVYQKREKTFLKGHSYTPKSAFWEIAVAGLFVSSIIGAFIRWITFKLPPSLPEVIIYIIFPILTILTLSSSLLTYIFKRDAAVGFWALFIIPLRAITTGSGVLFGWLSSIRGRSK